jgi:hypothetical protein
VTRGARKTPTFLRLSSRRQHQRDADDGHAEDSSNACTIDASLRALAPPDDFTHWALLGCETFWLDPRPAIFWSVNLLKQGLGRFQATTVRVDFDGLIARRGDRRQRW